jgi:hypothetical protein
MKMSGRKKTTGRQKSGGRRKPGSKRKDAKQTRKNTRTAERRASVHMRNHRKTEPILAKELIEMQVLGNDSKMAKPIMLLFHLGRYHDAAEALEGYAESFNDPSVEKSIMDTSALLHKLEHSKPRQYIPSVENKDNPTSYYAFAPTGIWYEVITSIDGGQSGMYRTMDEKDAIAYYKKNKSAIGIQKMDGSHTGGYLEVNPSKIMVKGKRYRKAYLGPHTKKFADDVVRELDNDGTKAIAKEIDRGWLIYVED